MCRTLPGGEEEPVDSSKAGNRSSWGAQGHTCHEPSGLDAMYANEAEPTARVCEPTGVDLDTAPLLRPVAFAWRPT